MPVSSMIRKRFILRTSAPCQILVIVWMLVSSMIRKKQILSCGLPLHAKFNNFITASVIHDTQNCILRSSAPCHILWFINASIIHDTKKIYPADFCSMPNFSHCMNAGILHDTKKQILSCGLPFHDFLKCQYHPWYKLKFSVVLLSNL
jgi:hypothetical protein